MDHYPGNTVQSGAIVSKSALIYLYDDWPNMSKLDFRVKTQRL